MLVFIVVLSSLLNKSVEVPSIELRTVGSHVYWHVNPKRKGGITPFMASGTIVEIYETRFGGTLVKMGARIETDSDYQERYPNRKYTTVALDKLRVTIPS
jgi:hypothetical protein